MKSLFSDTGSNEEDPSFEEHEHKLVVFFAPRAAALTIFMILLGSLLDHFYYPELFYHFLVVRVIASAFIAAMMYAATKTETRRAYRRTHFLWVLSPQAMICYMIALSGGADSIYFVGLQLALTGLAVFWPVKLREAAFFSGGTIALYLLACALGTPGTMFVPELAGNLIFTSLFAFILFSASILVERWRRKVFDLQRRIRGQRDDLAATNRQLADAKLKIVQSEKMASLGTLAAGLLHEMSNPVNYNKIALQLAKSDVQGGKAEAAISNIDDAMLGTNRLAMIIGDLRHLAFQSPEEAAGELGVVNLAQVTRVAIRLTTHVCKGMSVEVDVDQNVQVKGDGSSLTSVLVNLIENAASSIKSAGRGAAGKIVVRTHRAERPNWISMSVRDNGTGVSPEVAERMFEPFFTTKQVHEGMGMGLAICYGVVRRHGSELRLSQSAEGMFEMTFDLEVVSDE